MLNIRVLKNIKELLSIKRQWQQFFDQSQQNNIYTSFEWVVSWWASCGCGSLFIDIAEDNSELRCIAPLFKFKRYFCGLPHTQISFIGTKPTNTLPVSFVDRLLSIDKRYGWADHVDFIYDRNTEAGCRPIVRFLKKSLGRCDLLSLRELSSRSATIRIIEEEFANDVFSVKKTIGSSTRTIEINGDYETYKASLSKKIRKNINLNSNRLKKLGKTSFTEITDGQKVSNALPNIISLEKKSWKGRSNIGAFSNKEDEIFHSSLALRAAKNNHLSLFVLTHEDTVISYCLNFHIADQLYLHNTASHPEFDYYSPGFNLLLEIISTSFTCGIKKITMGKGDEYFKKALTSGSEDNIWFSICKSHSFLAVQQMIEFGLRPKAKSTLTKMRRRA